MTGRQKKPQTDPKKDAALGWRSAGLYTLPEACTTQPQSCETKHDSQRQKRSDQTFCGHQDSTFQERPPPREPVVSVVSYTSSCVPTYSESRSFTPQPPKADTHTQTAPFGSSSTLVTPVRNISQEDGTATHHFAKVLTLLLIPPSERFSTLE
jgi:hypothetical protein